MRMRVACGCRMRVGAGVLTGQRRAGPLEWLALPLLSCWTAFPSTMAMIEPLQGTQANVVDNTRK